ncbi:hypothetical protein HMSSN036_82520 [Paenibacillus macerans]|nr:hypothetical protein HMSSN036_82520 [Paenibacillus macerans]
MINIAFIAHDRKKEDIVNFAIAYEHVFKDKKLYSTGTTGKQIMENTSLKSTVSCPARWAAISKSDH